MNIERLRTYCLELDNVQEELPFGPDTLVFKVSGKIFLLLNLEAHPLQFNVKCDPEYALELRERYPNAVFPGYHMNKRHWNTILASSEFSDQQLLRFVEESYTLVCSKLPKKHRNST